MLGIEQVGSLTQGNLLMDCISNCYPLHWAFSILGSKQNVQIGGLLKNGFETLQSVNEGGFKVTPFNDSRCRTWLTDDKYAGKNSDLEDMGVEMAKRMESFQV